MTTIVSPTVSVIDTARRRAAGMARFRAIVGLLLLVGLGLTFGASLLFARSYVPAATDSARSSSGAHDAKSQPSGAHDAKSQPADDPNC